jgi:DNA-binding LytR/AlgR family response regulator
MEKINYCSEIKLVIIAFVDDDEKELEAFKRHVADFEKEKNVSLESHYFRSAFDLLEGYGKDFSAIFLDINMPQMNGMETARKIRESDQNVEIVFVTNLAQYAIEGYKVRALDYVLKPVNYFEFALEMEKILARQTNKKENYFFFQNRSTAQKISFSDIVYCEIYAHDVTIHSKKGDFSFRGALKDIEAQADPRLFVRCNSGTLVNLACVVGIKNQSAVLADGKKLEIARSRKKGFMDALTSFLNS